MIYIDIRNKAESGKVTKTYKFTRDVSLIVTSMSSILVIEHNKDSKNTLINLAENEGFSVRNWGN